MTLRTFYLSGFPIGDAPTLTVGETAIWTPPTGGWGVPDDSGGGDDTVQIVVDRTTLRCAPDSVRFSVDLSGAGFDVPATHAPSGDAYNPQLHDLIYLWDFGDSGSWSAPVNSLEVWRSKTSAKGPWVAHCYAAPSPAGTPYEVSVLVIDPATGKTASGATQIDVADPGDVYPGAQTICVSTSGNFTGAPAGASTITLSGRLTTAHAEWVSKVRNQTRARVLFRAGETFDVGLELTTSDPAPPLFGAFGSGDKPVLNAPSDNFNNNRVISAGGGTYVGLNLSDFRATGLRFAGGFDPTVYPAGTPGFGGSAIRLDDTLDMVIHDCVLDGFTAGSFYMQINAGYPQKCHFDDCVISNFGGQYPTFFGKITHPDGAVSFTGTRIAQNPLALWIDNGAKAPIRVESVPHFHMRSCDIFHVDSTQQALKLFESAVQDGLIGNVHSNVIESCATAISVNHNSSQTFDSGVTRNGGALNNVVIDGNILIGMPRIGSFMALYGQGVTARNNLGIQPDVPSYMMEMLTYVAAQKRGSKATALVAPIRFYNNTFVMLRSSANNNGRTPDNVLTYVDGITVFSDVAFDNNVVHAPGRNVTAFAPLDTDTALGITPRNAGIVAWDSVNSVALPLDASYATTGILTTFQPISDPGGLGVSAAIGGALTGLTAYSDILMQPRPLYPSVGAWEPAA